jgi:hypothetical protein
MEKNLSGPLCEFDAQNEVAVTDCSREKSASELIVIRMIRDLRVRREI